MKNYSRYATYKKTTPLLITLLTITILLSQTILADTECTGGDCSIGIYLVITPLTFGVNCPPSTSTINGTYDMNGSDCLVVDWNITSNTLFNCEGGSLYYYGTQKYLFTMNNNNIEIKNCGIMMPIHDEGINNTFNNVRPLYITYSEFEGYPETTSLEELIDIDIDAVNITLENRDGIITFSQPINLSMYGDLDYMIELTHNKIVVNAKPNPSLSSGGGLTFKDTGYDREQEVMIWKDDRKDKTIPFVFEEGNVTLNVTEFSTYELKKFLYGDDVGANDMTGAMIDTGTKTIIGFGSIAIILGMLIAGTITYVLIKKKKTIKKSY